jgi:hypothetical protein
MILLRWKLLPLALLGLLLAGLAGASAADGASEDVPPGAAPGEPAEPAAEPAAEEVELGTLRAAPTVWVGRRVRFVMQFQEVLDTWNPGMSRFGTRDWVALSAWEDERFTWDQSTFEDPLQRLFVRRDGALEVLARAARTYERFEAVGTVREVFLDEPWIELETMRPLFELVGEGTILHVGRAREFALEGRWDLAIEQFERARSAPLPAHAQAELERQIVECSRLRENPAIR